MKPRKRHGRILLVEGRFGVICWAVEVVVEGPVGDVGAGGVRVCVDGGGEAGGCGSNTAHWDVSHGVVVCCEYVRGLVAFGRWRCVTREH